MNLAISRQRGLEVVEDNATGPHRIGEIGRGFLNHVNLIDACSKLFQGFGGKRPSHAQLEDVYFRACFLHMLIYRAGADDADALRCAFGRVALHRVVRTSLNPFANLLNALYQHLAARLGEGGHHNPLRAVLFVGALFDFRTLPYLNRGFGVGDAHRRTHHNGRIELFRDAVSIFREAMRLSGIGRFHDGNHRRHGIVAGILLVLRGEHSRVVGS